MVRQRSLVLIIFIAVFYVATTGLNTFFKKALPDSAREPDIIQNVFGGMRSFVADWAFLRAEEYHHRGLPFLGAAAYHNGRSTLMEEKSGAKEEEHNEARQQGDSDLFARIFKAVKVTEDSHLLPSEEKEVLPWFYTEVAFNPHDIRGYVLGGYWLQRLGRHDESMQFLQEGLKVNPDSAQILTSIGRLYYRENKYDEALDFLDQACKLWQGNKPPNIITNSYIETDRMLAFETRKKIIELKSAGSAR